MKASITLTGNLSRSLIVELPASSFTDRYTQKLNEISRTLTLPGFRKGKIPRDLVEKRFASSVKADVEEAIIKETLQNAIVENGLKIASSPNLISTKLSKETFIYQVEFEVFPDVDIANLNTLEFEQFSVKTTDEDVDEQLKVLQKRATTFKPVKRASKLGDQIAISFSGRLEDSKENFDQADNLVVILGEGRMIEGFEDALLGLTINKEKEFACHFPKNYEPNPTLAGKNAVFAIKVNSVASPTLPALDKKFANSYGKKTLAELKKALRLQLEEQVERQIGALNKHKFFEALLNKHPCSLPPTPIAREAEQLQKSIKDKGDSASQKTPEDFMQEAERRVRLGFLLDSVREVHKISVNRQDIEAKVAALTIGSPEPKKQLDELYKNPSMVANLESAIIEEKLHAHATKLAKVTNVEKTFPEMMEGVL